jgi:trans-2,3-dihydro-3-hydroxyanthranilate isomerase
MRAHKDLHYKVVDVFTENALEGNALAVFPHAAALDQTTMQRIARELNLSETVFIVPSGLPGCEARLKIFAPRRELDFAGHPTIGASFVLLEERAMEAFQVEENVGPVQVRVAEGLIWLTTPRIEDGPRFDSAQCAEAIGLELCDLAGPEPRLLDAGNPTLFIALKNKSSVDQARIGVFKHAFPKPVCVFVFAATSEGAYSRMFAPEIGIPEDPATGSSTGPLALYMMRNGLVPAADGTRFVSEQGTAMGRRSLLHVHVRGAFGADGIEVGGQVTSVATGTMYL